MKNSKIEATYNNRILSVKFLENASINEKDLEEIYSFANEKAAGKTYGVIFEALNHFDVTEDAIHYMVNNPYNTHILSKAYVLNTKEAERKTKLHLLFDHPSLKPCTFHTNEEGVNWLRSQLDKTGS